MKRVQLLKVIMILAILGTTIFTINLHQKVESQRKLLQVQQKKLITTKEKERGLIRENRRLSDEVTTTSKALKKIENKDLNTETNTNLDTEFVCVVTNLFEANLNFTPKNFKEKQKEVSHYLSEGLKKSYFGEDRQTYQEANGTTSKLISLDVYIKSWQKNVLEGLVVVSHKSRTNDQSWMEGMNIFKVTYDKDSAKVTEIKNLGTGYKVKE